MFVNEAAAVHRSTFDVDISRRIAHQALGRRPVYSALGASKRVDLSNFKSE
ncbi:MAG: hypothetical protein WBL44_05320 [Nitrososphaeraceae archaeon]